MYFSSVPFSGIVVTYNEDRYLSRCLDRLSFCEQLIVIDLGSTDYSIDIAKKHRAEIIHHEWVPVVEEIRQKAVNYARNNWIVFLDPDEIFPDQISPLLSEVIYQSPNLAAIRIPWRYYFKGKPVRGTIWGKKTYKKVIIHKSRVLFPKNVHRGIKVKEGYTSVNFPYKHEYTILHYWCDSHKQLFRKHWRYLKKEGEARYRIGERFHLLHGLIQTFSSFKKDLIDHQGFKSGSQGIFLSLFHATYILMCQFSLWQYQLKARSSFSKYPFHKKMH